MEQRIKPAIGKTRKQKTANQNSKKKKRFLKNDSLRSVWDNFPEKRKIRELKTYLKI